MADLIGFPFRVTKSGYVSVRPDGGEQCYAEELAIMCMTRPGERELVPDYGLPDIAYEGVIQEQLASKIALFGPPVRLTNIKSSFPRDGEQQIVIEYEPLTDEYESEEAADE